MRAIVSVAGWTQTLRRRGDTGPIRYGRSHTAPGVPAEDAVRVILAEARRIASPKCHAESVGQGASGRKSSVRSLIGARESALSAQREKATRDFLGDAPPTLDDGEMIDLADDAEEAMPSTVTVKGLRAAEELIVPLETSYYAADADLLPLLARAIDRIHRSESVSSLFEPPNRELEDR